MMTHSPSFKLSVLLSLTVLSVACEGTELGVEATTEDPSVVSGGSLPPPDMVPIDGSAEPFAGFYNDDPKFEVRINHDADALTDEVLPALSEEYGLDEMELSDQTLVTDTAPGWVTALLGCYTSSNHFQIRMLDPVVRAELSPGTTVMRFDSGRKILTDVDMPHFEAEFQLQFLWTRDVTSWWCNTFGSNYDFRVNVNVDGVAGDLDLTMSDGSGGDVEVDSIDDFELDVDSVSFDSSFLTSLTNIGLSVADAFGGSCSSLTSCVNDAVDENFTSRTTIKDAIKDAINEAIAQASTLEGDYDFGIAELDYLINLDSVTTNDSKSRLVTVWDVDFDSDLPDASCASGLTKKRYPTPSDQQTDDDLDILIPFKKVSDLLYTVAKQGDLCAPFTWGTFPNSATIQVKPTGSFSVSVVHDNELSLSVPIKVEGLIGANATSAITGTLEISGELVPVCHGGFQLVPTEVQLDGLTGTMSYTLPNGLKLTMNATSFINSRRAAAETAILNALLPGLSVVPESFGFSGKYVDIGDVLYSSSGITIGLNILDSCP